MQVGDFGIWTHTFGGIKFLDELNELLRHYGRKVYALGGNHENWDHWNWYVENMPKDYNSGFSIVRSHILLAPRVHRWVWGGKQFQVIAGAASIDKDIRVQDEQAGGSRSWWPEEEITDAEIDKLIPSPVDYLFTHDCSNKTNWGFQLVPDLNSQIHRERIDRALGIVTPKMHFHGHMHKRYEWMNPTGADDNGLIWTDTYGLNCNGHNDSWGILDTGTNKFVFHPFK
jgi:hypothetical protein